MGDFMAKIATNKYYVTIYLTRIFGNFYLKIENWYFIENHPIYRLIVDCNIKAFHSETCNFSESLLNSVKLH